jgi:Protein of unknown function (DUF3102)
MTSDLARSNSLADLAARIKAEHETAFGHTRLAVQHAAKCGRLLIEAKAQVEHGQWLPWVEANTGIGPRQCQKYMRLAEGWAEIESKCDPSSHLTINGALGLLGEPPLPESVGGFIIQKILEIDPRVEFTPTSMKLPDGLSLAQWRAIGKVLIGAAQIAGPPR